MKPEYKTWIINELENWAETFNNNYPDHMEDELEDEIKVFDEIQSLIKKLTKDKCTKNEYENILFHLWQIKYNS